MENKQTQLAVQDDGKIREELNLTGVLEVDNTSIEVIDQEAENFANGLLKLSSSDLDGKENLKNAIETLGLKIQEEAAHKSKMLQAPIKELSRKSSEGSDVGNALLDLQMKVEDLDPNKINFDEPGWFGRTLSLIPGIGKKMKKYFAKYQSSQTTINIIVNSLKNGKNQLIRDNDILKEDQKHMRNITFKLQKAITLGQTIDKKLDYKLQREIEAGSDIHKFVSDELLFPLRQRIMDLQQQLAVNQQGVLAIEIIIRNNKELIRGVDRALNVTVSALQTAVTVALALGHQKVVLSKIDALNTTTSNLIAGTAAKLKTQGVEIHKKASEGMLEMDKLKSAFTDINSAMEDISRFRQDALPRMAETILELDKMSVQSEKAIQKMEKGNIASSNINWEVLD